MISPLAVATANAHKLGELREMLGLPLLGLRDFPGAPEPEETGATFEENAWIKAESLSRHCGGWALADDSGLEVFALGGAPGVHSARFAGRHGDDTANNSLLLEKLDGVDDRRARFVCVMALCSPQGERALYRGECQGRISAGRSGIGGFGYDPLFVPDGYDQTFAELGSDIKNKISHRAKALAAFLSAQPWINSPTSRSNSAAL